MDLCEENRSIVVRNIGKSFCNREGLEMYFNTPSLSGGGATEAITMLGLDVACVTFKDPQGWMDHSVQIAI